MDDQELRERLRAGDGEALESVFAQHRSRLLGILRLRIPARLARRVDAEDVLQESFLTAQKRVAQLPDELSLFVWLRKLTLQTMIDTYRHHFEVQARGIDRELRAGIGSPDTATLSGLFVASTTSPSLALARHDLEERIASILDGMEAEDREVLVMRHFEDASNPEVAEALGISPKVAARRYERAIRRLGREIRGLGASGRDLLPGND